MVINVSQQSFGADQEPKKPKFKKTPEKTELDVDAAQVGDLAAHFKRRLELALDDIQKAEEVDGRVALQEIKKRWLKVEEKKDLHGIDTTLSANLAAVSSKYGRGPELTLFHFKARLEAIMHLAAEKGLIKFDGNHVILFNHLKEKQGIAFFARHIREVFLSINKFNKDKQDYSSFDRDYIIAGLDSLYQFHDESGQKVTLKDYLGLNRAYAGGELDRYSLVVQRLKQKKARRLAITGRNEKIPLDKVESLADEENGYLCILDESGQFYRKIRYDEVFDLASLTQQRFAEMDLITKSLDGILRRSDYSHLTYDYRALGFKNRSPMVNRLNYFFPTAEFYPVGSERKVKINPELDDFITLSPDYSVLRINRAAEKQFLLLHHLPAAEISDFQREQISKYNCGTVRVEDTLARTKAFDITEFVPVRSDETPQQYAKKVIKFSDLDRLTDLYRRLFDQTRFELQKFPLEQQLGFAVFYESVSAEVRKKINNHLTQLGADFFRAFQLCNHQLNLGQQILDIVEKHGEKSRDLLVHISSILNITNNTKDFLANPEQKGAEHFYTVVSKRAESFIRDAAKLPSGSDLSKFIAGSERYHLPVIAKGAEFAAKSVKEVKTVVPAAELAQALIGTEVSNLPAGSLVKSTDPKRIFDPGNYTNPELFSHRDAKMVSDNLDRAYSKIDPEWLIYLKHNILKDLANPDVTFVTIRSKDDHRLLGVAKTRPANAEKTEYYIGTMYVDPAYQSQFNFGDYLQGMAENNIPGKLPYWGSAAVSNPAISRHIDHAGATASEIVFEGDDQHQSKELFKLNFRKSPDWVTKNNRLFSRELIMEIADGKRELEGKYRDKIKIVKTVPLPAGESALVSLSKPYFDQGWHITRYFESTSSTESGKKYLYLAFEKPAQLEAKSSRARAA